MKEFEKALDARSKSIAKQLNDLDKSTGKKIMEEDKKSNRIGAGHGEGGNSVRLRGGEEISGRISTRPDTHSRSDAVNREQHGNGNSTRIAGGGKAVSKKNHGSDKHNSGKQTHGKAAHGNDEKDDSFRLKVPLDSDLLLSSNEWGYSGKAAEEGTAVNGTIDTPTGGIDNRHALSWRGNSTPTSTTGGGGDDVKLEGRVHDTTISVDTTLGMLEELDSMKNRLHERSAIGGAGSGVSRVGTHSELSDMMPDMSSIVMQPSQQHTILGDHKGGSGNHPITHITVESTPTPHSHSASATNIFGYPVSSNHARWTQFTPTNFHTCCFLQLLSNTPAVCYY